MVTFLKLTKKGHVSHKTTIINVDKVVDLNEYNSSLGGTYTEVQTDKGVVHVEESLEEIEKALEIKEVGVSRNFRTVEKVNIQ